MNINIKLTDTHKNSHHIYGIKVGGKTIDAIKYSISCVSIYSIRFVGFAHLGMRLEREGSRIVSRGQHYLAFIRPVAVSCETEGSLNLHALESCLS